MTVKPGQGDDVKSTAIRNRGAELDRMHEERFPDTDEVFAIADAEGYIISEQHHPELFRHYTEIANLWTAQGYLPRCGPLTRQKLETVLQWDKMQPTTGQTVGEAAFESFCDRAPDYECRRVKEGLGKTPDYIVTIGDQKIIAEVKEVGRQINSRTVGNAARRMIHKANRQLKALTEERYPGISVLYDPFSLFQASGPMGSTDTRAAMYGCHTLGLSDTKNPAEPPRVVGEWAGKDQTTTPKKNTTTSAVCVLRLDSQLLVYHNRFAAIRIDPLVMAFEGVSQFRISEDMLNWLPVE